MFGVIHECVGGDGCMGDGEVTVVWSLSGRDCSYGSDRSTGAVFVRVVAHGEDGVGGCLGQEGAKGSEGSFLTVVCVVVNTGARGT